MTFHGKIETCTILGHGLIRADGFPFEEPEWSSYRPIERELTMYIRGVKTSCLCVANMCIFIYYILYIYILLFLLSLFLLLLLRSCSLHTLYRVTRTDESSCDLDVFTCRQQPLMSS